MQRKELEIIVTGHGKLAWGPSPTIGRPDSSTIARLRTFGAPAAITREHLDVGA